MLLLRSMAHVVAFCHRSLRRVASRPFRVSSWFLACAAFFGTLAGAPHAFAATPTVTTLAITSGGSAVSTSTNGVTVTLTATVSASGTPVTPGQVNFCDATATFCTDIHIIASAQLTAAGTAVFSFRPGVGSHSYKAVFAGTATYAGSASTASALTVTSPYVTATTLQAGITSASVTVTGLSPQLNPPASAPSGTVNIVDTSNNNAVLASSTLTAGASGFLLAWPPVQPTGQFFATGDFNGDGIPDVATLSVANPNTEVEENVLTIYLGNGDGTFTAGYTENLGYVLSYCQQEIECEDLISGIATGDFNNDGVTDVAVTTENWLLYEDPPNLLYGGQVTILLGNGDGTFTAGGSAQTNDAPGIPQIADFNGDGNLDLVVPGTSDGEFTILLGNGDGTFTTHYGNLQTASTAAGLAVGDFNHDGIPDLAMPGANQVVLLIGNGDGTFTAASQPAATIEAPLDIATADMNGDGIPDLVVSSAYQSFQVFLGQADGSFSASTVINNARVYQGSGGLAIGDFNLDGIPDVAWLTQPSTTIYAGAANGSLSLFATGGGSDSLKASVTDFNGDGIPDIAFSSGGILLAENQHLSTASANFTLSPGTHTLVAQYPGDANYAPSASPAQTVTYLIPTVLRITSSASTVTVGQSVTYTVKLSPYALDGDTTDGQVITFRAYNGTYDGSLLGTATLSGGVATFTVSELVLGAHPVAAIYAGNGQFQGSEAGTPTQVNEAQPTLTLTSPSSVVIGQSITLTATMSGFYGSSGASVAFIAYSGDGNPAVYLGQTITSSSGVATLPWGPSTPGPFTIIAEFGGNSDNAYAESNIVPVTVLTASQAASTVTLQVNGSSTTTSVPSGTPVTLTASITSGGSAITAGTVRFCDLNLTGQLCSTMPTAPTAQVNSGGQATLTTRLGPGPHTLVAEFFATGAASESTSAPLTVNGGLYSITLTDTCNGAASCQPNATIFAPVSSLVPIPSGTVNFVDQSESNQVVGSTPFVGLTNTVQFAAGSSAATGNLPFSTASADFNHDGFPDLAVTNSGDNTVSVLLGNGDGTFQTQATYATGAGPYAVASGDFNHDGNPDLAVTNFSDNTVSILLGNADGTLQPQQAFDTGGGPVAVAVGDFNKDGQLDLAIVNNLDKTVSILFGNGDGTFQPQVTYATGAAPVGIVTADFDDNESTDLAVANNGDSTISVLLNNGDGTFKPQVTYATGANPIGITEADFNGDKVPDLAVADTGDGTIDIFYGQGGGIFKAAKNVGNVAGVQAIAAGTFGNLGLPGFVLLGPTQSNVFVNLGNGSFNGGHGAVAPAGAIALAVADWNGDSRPDYAMLGNTSGTVVTALNTSVNEWSFDSVSLSFSPAAGQHIVVAQYPGDSLYASATSGPSTVSLPTLSDTLTLSSGRNPSNYGDSVTLTAKLNPYSSGTFTTNGESITFSSGTTVLGTGALAAGVATLTTTSVPTGVNTITATYASDQVFNSSTASLSQTVRPPTLTVTAENATRVYGAANPAFTVKVTGALNGDTFTTAASTTASQTSTTGTYSIVPSISGSAVSNYNIVKINGTLTVTPAIPTITLESSANPAPGSTAVTFRATLASAAGSPSGTISFYDGSALLKKATVTSDAASCTTSSLTAGSHAILAIYSGDTNFAAVTSSAINETVETPATLTSPASGSTLTGSTATFSWTAGSQVTQYVLHVGTTGMNSSNIFGGAVTGLSKSVTGIPTTGGTLYVRLYTFFAGSYLYSDSIYTEAIPAAPASITSPAPGSTLTSSTVLFSWTTGSQVVQNLLHVGTTGVGSSNIFGGAVTGQSQSVKGIPTTGATLYVRLYSQANGAWQYLDYTYTEESPAAPAAITSPAPGSTLTGSSVSFSWTAGSDVTQYVLHVGTTGVNSSNIFGGAVTGDSKNITGIPATGGTLYVRLYSFFAGSYQYADYTYTEAIPATPAAITSPAPGSTLTGSSATFSWTAGSHVTQYVLHVGTSGVDSSNLFGGAVTGDSKSVTGIPTTGATLFVRLYSFFAGSYQYADYTYTEFSVPAPATITSPPPGSSLTGSTVTFTWTVGTQVKQYDLHVGTTGAGSTNIFSGVVSGQSQSVTGIPTIGGKLYVRLYSLIADTWQYEDYTFTEQ